ncbi:MAG: helix-turn-helix domain-containing protein [Streptomycetaceae bacterium]|nr:helix-turn-helix domain-containing protein [Streptomycetaceae bacterium]
MPQPEPAQGHLPADGEPPAEAVRPLERGLALLRAMAVDPDPRTRPGDLARVTGLARATVDRIAATLVRLGYVRHEGRDLALTPQAAELGNAYLASSGLAAAVRPYAEALADRLDESVSVAVPDGDGVRFVVQATRRRAMAVSFRIGDLLPAERCAPGALFAAAWTDADWQTWRTRHAQEQGDTAFPALPLRRPRDAHASSEVEFADRIDIARTHGHSTDSGLIEPGLIAIAFPVHDGDGRAVCALSVVSHTSRHTPATLADIALGPARDTAAAMAAAIRPDAPGPAPRPHAPAADPRLKDELGAEYLQSLARGLDVLRALGTTRGPMTLADVARAAALPRATARRSLITLDYLGYAEPHGKGFALTPRVLDLGYARLAGLTLPEVLLPHLAELVRTVGESASAAVLDGDDIRYIARVPTRRIMRVDITVGTRMPAALASMGRVLLAALPPADRAAYLSRVRIEPRTPRSASTPEEVEAAVDRAAAAGYAQVDQELEEGLRSLSVPVRDADGHVVAAVNVAHHASRGTPDETRDEILPPLRLAAARAEADLRALGQWSLVR